jgi:hypothetical protein
VLCVLVIASVRTGTPLAFGVIALTVVVPAPTFMIVTLSRAVAAISSFRRLSANCPKSTPPPW